MVCFITHGEFFFNVQDERGGLPPSSNARTTAILSTATSSVPQGIEIAVEFKPVEHPTEPLDYDQPIPCPQPEPSILNVSLISSMTRAFLVLAYLLNGFCC